ncbi:MAG: OB-fold nucleic acid binding domain-containing protein [Bacteroidota bacterium]
MKRVILFSSLTTVVSLLLFVTAAFAQGGRWGRGVPGTRIYNPSTVETITGKVTAVDTISSLRGMGGGVRVTLQTKNGKIDVYLGPSWYLSQKSALGGSLKTGDELTVTGSKVSLRGTDVLIAAEVRKGSTTLQLRDKDGYPLWSGGRR